MVTTKIRYEWEGDLIPNLSKADKKLAQFDKHLARTDKALSKTKGHTNVFDKVLPKEGRLKKTIGQLEEIPAINTGILSSAGALINPYVAAGAAVAAAGAYTVKAVRVAEEWNHSMAKANVTIQATPAALDKISDRLQNMAGRSTADFMTVPQVFTEIVSGVGDTEKSFDILDYSLKGTQAGFADLSTVADATVNVLNAVGSQAKGGAGEIMDVLFATMNKGKGEFTDMARYLPKVIPYSNQLGTSFKETAGAFALFSAKGQSIEQTTVLLQNTFSSLTNPAKLKRLQEYVNVFDAKGKVRAFSDIIGDLDKKMQGLSDKGRTDFLGTLGLDNQAASAFSILTQNADELRDFIDYTKNSEGALDKALGDGKSAAHNIAFIKNKWKDWQLTIGKKVAPFWDKFTEGLGKVMQWLEMVEEKTGIFSGSIDVLGFVFDKLTWPIKTVWNLFKVGIDFLNRVWLASVKLGEYLENKFPNAFGYAKIAVMGLKTMFKDLWFTISETYKLIKNIVTFDWGKVKYQIHNLSAHEYGDFSNTPAASFGSKGGSFGYMSKLLDLNKKSDNSPGLMPTNNKSFNVDKGDKGKSHGSGIRSVVGGGAQVRHVTVKIGNQVKDLTIHVNNLQQTGKAKIKRIIQEIFTEAVRDAEVALSTS